MWTMPEDESCNACVVGSEWVVVRGFCWEFAALLLVTTHPLENEIFILNRWLLGTCRLLLGICGLLLVTTEPFANEIFIRNILVFV